MKIGLTQVYQHCAGSEPGVNHWEILQIKIIHNALTAAEHVCRYGEGYSLLTTLTMFVTRNSLTTALSQWWRWWSTKQVQSRHTAGGGGRQLPLASQHGPGWCFVAYSDLAHRHNDRCVALVHLLNLLIFTRAVQGGGVSERGEFFLTLRYESQFHLGL